MAFRIRLLFRYTLYAVWLFLISQIGLWIHLLRSGESPIPQVSPLLHTHHRRPELGPFCTGSADSHYFCHKFALEGLLFLPKGQVTDDGSNYIRLPYSPVATSMIRNLTGDMSKVLEGYGNVYGKYHYFCMSPAVLHDHGSWFKTPYNLIVSRLLLIPIKHAIHSIQNSHLSVGRYDTNYELLGSSRLLAMPTAVGQWSGAEDPRIHRDPVTGDIAVSIILLDINNKRRQYVWWMKHSKLIRLQHDDEASWQMWEKNWVFLNLRPSNPLEKERFKREERQLYIVHRLLPLRILQCNSTGNCIYYYEQPHSQEMENGVIILSGGTPFEHFQADYYFAFIHTTNTRCTFLHPKMPQIIGKKYSMHLAVLHVGQSPRLVYVSDPIMFHPDMLLMAPRFNHIMNTYFFPVSIGYKNIEEDVVHVGAHRADEECWMLEIRGIFRLLEQVVSTDRQYASITSVSMSPEEIVKQIDLQCGLWNDLINAKMIQPLNRYRAKNFEDNKPQHQPQQQEPKQEQQQQQPNPQQQQQPQPEPQVKPQAEAEAEPVEQKKEDG